MRYIVDTSVWSEALRRKPHRETEPVRKLSLLLKEGEGILMPGIILQEVLQGVKDRAQFARLREHLVCFPALAATQDDCVFAAELFNACRTKGVSASTIDFLIASLAIRNGCALLTSDRDFVHMAKYCDLKVL